MIALGTAPVLFNKSYAHTFFKNGNVGKEDELKKFGDGRDWFFEKRFGVFVPMNVPGHYDPTVNSMIRKLQPNAVINNRGFDEGDFSTPERDFEEVAKFTC